MGVAIVTVLVVCWLLLDASDVLRSERSAPEHTTTNRSDVSEPSDPSDSDPPAEQKEKEAPRVPAPIDLSKVDLDLDLHGVVVDANDKPIPGAKLQTITYPTRRASTLHTERYYDEVKGPSTLSATDGTFAIRLARGSLWNLRAAAEGLASTELTNLMAGEYVKVVLSPGVTLLVLARNDQAQPIAGVKLRIFSNARSPAQVTRYGTTNERGLARFEGMPPRLGFWVDPSHDVWGSSGWQELATQDSGEQQIEITLVKGRTIAGRVTDADTGAPIEGAKVGMGWTMRRHTFTDERGEYSLPGWSGKGVQEIAVDSPLYARDNKKVGAAERIDFQLKPGGSASGRIVNEAGTPVSGARVDAVGSRKMGQLQVTSRRYTHSDEQGRFRLDGLNVELPHSLVVIADGYGRKLLDFAPERPEKRLGDVTLSKALTIEGVVYEGDKQPLARLRITLTDAGPKEQSWPRIMYGNKESRYTDHLGRFRFPGQSPGKFKLTVRRDGFQPAEQVVTLTPGKDLRNVELKFLAGTQFVVRVHDEDGNPISGAFVSVQYEGGSAQARTDEKGAARFNVTGAVTRVQPPYLPADRALIRPQPVTQIDPTQTEVRFVFKKGAVITGTVMLEGTPLSGARLEIWRDGKRAGFVMGQEDGTFRILGAPDERVDLILRGRLIPGKRGGMRMDTSTLLEGELRNITPGSKDVVVLAREVPNDGTLTVRVLDAEGKPAVGVTVSVGRSRGATGENGAVAFEALPRTAVTVVVIPHPNFADQLPPPPLNLTPTGQEVVLRFERGVPMSGSLLDVDGKPAANVNLFATMNRQFLGSAVTDAKGHFTLYVPSKLEGKVTIMAHFRTKDGVVYSARGEYGSGDAIQLQLAKR